MFRYLIAAFSLLSLSVHADPAERELHAPASLASTAGIISSIVNQSVSAISGDFIDCEVDAIIPGAEPLVIQRTYNSSDLSKGFIHTGWQLSAPQDLLLTFNGAKKNYQILCGDPSGCSLSYKNIKKRPKYKGKTIELWPEVTRGMTNVSFEEISGHTNLKNRYINWQKKSINDHARETLDVFDGKGAHRFFKQEKNKDKTVSYNLLWEKKHNGNQSRFSYSLKHRTLENITVENLDGIAYGSVSISGLEQEIDRDEKSYAYFTLSDGRVIEYKFEHFQNLKHSKATNYLTKVVRPNAPRIYYEYYERENGPGMIVKKKDKGDGRYILNQYYHAGKNVVLGDKITLGEQDNRINRVKCQYAPLGVGPEQVLAYSYLYNIHKNGSGETDAYNALGYRTGYQYDKNHRLISRDFYKGSNHNCTLYCADKYVWYESEEDEGNLHCHLFLDGLKHGIRARTFIYDEYGNPTRETLYGNITGKGHIRFPLDKEGLPDKNYCEKYTIARTYTTDGTNLLLTESEHSGKQAIYAYHTGQQLLKSKFEFYQGQIVKRHYYEYDRYGNLKTYFQDNGKTLADQFPDLSGTLMLVKRIKPKKEAPAMGLPEEEISEGFNYTTQSYERIDCKKYAYDSYGRVIREDVYGSANEIQYTISKAYDKYDHITEQNNPLGHIIVDVYDKHGNKTYHQGPCKDYAITYEYDYSNRLLGTNEHHPGIILSTRNTYDLLGNRITSTDIFGHTTNYAYNEFGAVTCVQGPLTPDQHNVLQRPTTYFEYDESGNITKITDPLGRVTLKTYQIHGKPTTITHPDGSWEIFEYNKDGSLAKTIARSGLVTKYVHDSYGNELVKEEIAPDGTLLGVTYSEYDGFNIITQISPAGHVTRYKYDCAGRLSEETRDDTKKTYAYDILGRRYKTCEWYGDHDTDFTANIVEYDLLNRVTEERTEDGHGKVLSKINNAYDESGNKILVSCEVDGNVSATYTEYNSLNKPVRIIDAAQNVTYFSYDYQFQNDLDQRVLQIKKTDPLGNITITTMDVAGREAKIEKQNAFGKMTAIKFLRYDFVGNLVYIVEGVISLGELDRVLITRWEYDAMNNLTAVIEAFNTPEEKRIHHSYNKAGQKELIAKSDGTYIHHKYDAKGRLSHLFSSDNTVSYRYIYDLDDHVISISDDVNNHVTERLYDHNARLASEKLGNGLTLRYSYDRQGRVRTTTLPDHSSVEIHYDALHARHIDRYNHLQEHQYRHSYLDFDMTGCLTKSKLIAEGGHLETHIDCLKRPYKQKTDYWQTHVTKFDVCSNLLEQNTNDPLGDCQTKYSYDDLYQVKSESGVAEHTYENDSIFNRVQQDKITYSHNLLNQLIKTSHSEYGYDKNGNLIFHTKEGKTSHYSYDALDRLIKVKSEDKQISYIYDALNRRIKKIVKQKSVDEEICYLYQGESEIGAYQNDTLIEFRVLGIGKGAEIGAAVALELYGQTYIPIHDLNGNLSCLIDAETNQVAEFYRYSAFGEEHIFDGEGERCEESQVKNPWRFASKRVDPETTFIYFGRRYYAPDIGRWITADPLGFEAGPNLYAYVCNSPLTHIDLYGLIGIGPTYLPMQERQFNLGSFLQFWGEHVVPIPYVQDAFCLPGHILKGGQLSDYESPSKYHSCFGHMGLPNAKENLVFGFSNGIMNNKMTLDQTIARMSEERNNTNMFFTHASTHGGGRDIAAVVLHKFGINTRDVQMQYKSYKQMIQAAGGVGSGGIVVSELHSKGASVGYQALKMLHDNERKMIHVYTYGAAKIIPPDAAGFVRNYISTRDSIPFMADPVEYMKAKLFNSEHVVFLKSNGPYFADHEFNNEVYSRQSNDVFQHYLWKYGK